MPVTFYYDFNNLSYEYFAVRHLVYTYTLRTLKVRHLLYTSLNPPFCYARKHGRMDTSIFFKVKDNVLGHHLKIRIYSEKPTGNYITWMPD